MAVTRALQFAKLFCLAALAVFLICCSVLLRDLRALVQQIGNDEQQLSGKLQSVVDTAQKASEAAYQAEQQQILTLNKTSLETYKTAAAARLVLVRTDKSLNDILVPRLARQLEDADILTEQAAQDLHATVMALQPTLENLARASQNAADTIADPEIKASLANLEETTKQSSVAMAHLADITAAGDETARYYQKKLTTPEGFLKTLANFVLDWGSKARLLLAK